MEETKRFSEDTQILAEIAENERIVTHPTKGQIRLRMPTLEIQRQIDSLARQKKKILREATDTIPDQEDSSKVRIVPAYRSRETLAREYRDLGWWTDEHEERLQTISNEYTGYLARLEMLGFESEADIYQGLSDAREALEKNINEDAGQEVHDAIFRLTITGGDVNFADKRLVASHASSTEVDSVIAEIEVLRAQYDSYVELAKTYVELVKLEGEKSTLFSDSWQDQLQYYMKLAQVYYCSTKANDGSYLWNSVNDIEKDPDTDFIKWLFNEIQAFWQGISDDARERFGKYNFTDRPSEGKSSSEESPATDTSKLDGDSQVKEQTTLLEALDTPAPSQNPS